MKIAELNRIQLVCLPATNGSTFRNDGIENEMEHDKSNGKCRLR